MSSYQIIDFNKGVTTISRMREYWYIIMPKKVKAILEGMGVEDGHLVVWDAIEETGNVIEVRLKILRIKKDRIRREKVIAVEQ